jgi:DNA processing protein
LKRKSPQIDLYAIGLSYIKDIGPVSIRKLTGVFGGAEAVFNASLKELTGVVGDHRAQAIKNFSGWDLIEKDLEKLDDEGVKIVSITEDAYPAHLKEISNPPTLLFIRGSFIPEDRYAVAIVGSRVPTTYGTSQAERMAGELARMGFTIVSGFARGIDTAGHRGAVQAGGRTIAVMGSGIDVPYPAENKHIMEKIATCGAVISEFPPGTPPDRANFPRRNRIISGLSLGVLVVEAAKDSGSLITAALALEQGKEVFSMPGNITSANSKGTNELIKKGARVVTRAEDILEELAPVLKGFLKKPANQKPLPELTLEEKRITSVLSPEPRHVDDIARELGMSAQEILGHLLSLELKGVLKQTAGKKFFIC